MISPDSCLVHKTWAHAPRDDGGLGGVDFPMMEVTLINILVHDTFRPSKNCGFQFFECHILRTPYVLDICQLFNLGHPTFLIPRMIYDLGMPPFQKSAVFFNIVQKAFDPPPPFI